MVVRKAKRQLKTLAKLLGVALMLSLYAIGSTQTGYLHQLFHPDEIAATHSTKQEEDPCHRAMYHGMDTGCRHEFHLGKLHSCGISHTLTHSDLLLFDTDSGVDRVLECHSIARPAMGIAATITDSHFTRGPPIELHV